MRTYTNYKKDSVTLDRDNRIIDFVLAGEPRPNEYLTYYVWKDDSHKYFNKNKYDYTTTFFRRLFLKLINNQPFTIIFSKTEDGTGNYKVTAEGYHDGIIKPELWIANNREVLSLQKNYERERDKFRSLKPKKHLSLVDVYRLECRKLYRPVENLTYTVYENTLKVSFGGNPFDEIYYETEHMLCQILKKINQKLDRLRKSIYNRRIK